MAPIFSNKHIAIARISLFTFHYKATRCLPLISSWSEQVAWGVWRVWRLWSLESDMIVTHLYCLLTILLVQYVRSEEGQDCQSVLESLECLSDHWQTLDCSYNKNIDPCSETEGTTLIANHHKWVTFWFRNFIEFLLTKGNNVLCVLSLQYTLWRV